MVSGGHCALGPVSTHRKRTAHFTSLSRSDTDIIQLKTVILEQAWDGCVLQP